MKKTLLVLSSFLLFAAYSPVHAENKVPALTHTPLLEYYLAKHPELATNTSIMHDFGAYTECKQQRKIYSMNEFEKRKFAADIEKAFAEKMASLKDGASYPKTFTINMAARFGKYDFDNQEFPFKPFPKGTYIPITKSQRGCNQTDHKWPVTFEVHFSNGEAFQGLPVKEADAAKVQTRYGRDVMLDITADIEKIDLEQEVKGRAQPKVTARITSMKVTHIDKKNRPRAVLGTFEGDEIVALEKKRAIAAKSEPMPFEGKTFVAWADKLEDEGLAERYKIDTSDVGTLKYIALQRNHNAMYYERSSITVEPTNVNADGTLDVEIAWDTKSSKEDTGRDETYSFDTEIGLVTLNITNADAFAGTRTIDKEGTRFLSHAGIATTYTNLFFTPVAFELKEKENGEEEKIYDVRVDKVEVIIRDLSQHQSKTFTFTPE